MEKLITAGGSGRRAMFPVTNINQLAGVSFLTAVKSYWDVVLNGALPAAPALGDRYLCVGSGLGWSDYNIYEWTGSVWNEYVPKEGDMVTVSYMSRILAWNGLYDFWEEYPQSWVVPVFDIYDNTVALPMAGRAARYIALVTANGWTKDHLYEWDGTQWHDFYIVPGSTVWVIQKGQLYSYDETSSWVQIPDTWEEPVISIYDNTVALPPAPVVGDRYIALVTANGWTINRIYEYSSTMVWVEFIPKTGTEAFVTAAALPYLYTGAAWVALPPLTAHAIGGVLHTASTVTDIKTKVSGPDFLLTSQQGEIATLTAKVTPVVGDLLVIEDSADSNKKKQITISSLPAPSPGGAAGGDLAGTYPNPTVAQASKSFKLTGIITDTIAAQKDNYNPAGLADASTIQLTLSGDQKITGIAGGVAGRILIIQSGYTGSTDKLTLENNSASSLAANRFYCPLSQDYVLSDDNCVILQYDAVQSRWIVIATCQAPYGTTVNTICEGNDSRLSNSRPPNGAASGDLAGSYPSPTVKQSSTAFALTGSITPAVIGGNQNDYNPAGLSGAAKLRLSTSASYALTGLAGGAAGRIIVIHNVGSFNLTLNNEDGGSSAANRFQLLASANHTLQPRECIILQYDSTLSRWHSIGEVMDPYGTTANTVCQGNDARLSDSRTPTAHALGGSAHSADTIANVNSKLSDGDMITTLGGEINALTEDTTPLADDVYLMEDSGSSYAKRKVKVTNLMQMAFPEFQFYADQLKTPTSSEYPRYGTAAATLAEDSANSAILTRQFNDTTQEAAAFDVFIPDRATSIIFDFVHRAQVAPGVAKQVTPALYFRQINDNAAIGTWSAETGLTPLDIPTNTNWQVDTRTVTLASLSLTAGKCTQFEIERNPTDASDNLVDDWNLMLLRVRFS